MPHEIAQLLRYGLQGLSNYEEITQSLQQLIFKLHDSQQMGNRLGEFHTALTASNKAILRSEKLLESLFDSAGVATNKSI